MNVDAAGKPGFDEVREGVLSGRLDPRIALECLLAVKLGLRSAAIVTIPAELPDGEVLGAQVDYEFKSRLAGQASDLKTRLRDTVQRKKMPPVAFKAYLLRSSFERNVVGSESYRAHRRAAEDLGLEVMESEVRPTIREWYLCLPDNREAVSEVLRRRHEIQKEMRRRFKPGDPIDFYIYPEERDPEHLRTLGALLGYPPCCVEEYLRERVTEKDAPAGKPEERAARQVARWSAEKGSDPPPAAYWLKDFFPCRPDCPQASAKGDGLRRGLAVLDPELARRYDDIRRENLARVRSGPEKIREYEEWLRSR
jgi:hypothetical protein